jgi:hypothetical protein
VNKPERAIAEAALKATRATNLEQLYRDIAKPTGASEREVKKVLETLVAAFVIRICATPASNRLAGDPHLTETYAWFEKGELWPKV